MIFEPRLSNKILIPLRVFSKIYDEHPSFFIWEWLREAWKRKQWHEQRKVERRRESEQRDVMDFEKVCQ